MNALCVASENSGASACILARRFSRNSRELGPDYRNNNISFLILNAKVPGLFFSVMRGCKNGAPPVVRGGRACGLARAGFVPPPGGGLLSLRRFSVVKKRRSVIMRGVPHIQSRHRRAASLRVLPFGLAGTQARRGPRTVSACLSLQRGEYAAKPPGIWVTLAESAPVSVGFNAGIPAKTSLAVAAAHSVSRNAAAAACRTVLPVLRTENAMRIR